MLPILYGFSGAVLKKVTHYAQYYAHNYTAIIPQLMAMQLYFNEHISV